MKEYERNRSDKPSRCKNCEYQQTRWKNRSCYFVRCPYGVKNTTFRKTPLKKEHFPKKEVVKNE